MKKLLLAAVVSAFAGLAAQAQSYSNAVMALNPIGYWPLSANITAAPSYVATNYGTLGSLGNGYYANTFPDSLGDAAYTLITTPETGATSDGDTSAGFNLTTTGDPSGYAVIPRRSPQLTPANAFTAEVWVEPMGGDPNDTSGASYASTEWASIIKEGYGGNGYGDPGDTSGNGYGWSVSLAGIYSLGYPVGWYEPGTPQLVTNATWVVDFFSGNNGGAPSLEFDVPMYEPTPQWFHLVLTYDGTNANFYTNGVLAATTVLGTPESTNKVWGGFPATATGAYTFTPKNGVSFAPDTVNPVVLGTIVQNANFINEGYPNLDNGSTIGFNEQTYNGYLDEAAIYTNALPAATVVKHFSDATSSDHTLYTNDVLSLNPPIYLRFDEPAYSEPAPTAYPTVPAYGSTPTAGVVQPNVLPGVPGVGDSGFGSTGEAVAFDGLDGAIDIPGAGAGLSGTPFDPTGNAPLSLVFWFKGNPGQYARFETILGRGDTAWRSSIDQGGLIHWNPGNGPEIKTTKNYNDGAWHQVVGVSDGNNVSLYVDNQLTATGTGAGGLGGSQFDLYIGGAPDYTITKPNGQAERMFAGDVTQVAFFGTALTPAQIQTLYYAANLPPSILTQPAASTVIVTTQTGALTAVASGTPPLSYQWDQNGAPISNGGSFSGVNTNTLTIANASSSDGGTYTLVVSNAYGAVTSAPAVVTISSAPIITTQPSPASSTLYAGNDVSFSVVATGAAPLTYQWFDNNSPISGATSTNLVIPAPAGSNNFTVQIANSIGTATSSVVAVTGEKFVVPSSGFVLNFNDAGNGVYAGLGVYQDLPSNTNWNPIPNAPGGTTPLATNSAGAVTLSTLSMVYGFNNGANDGALNNQPCFLVEYEAGVNSGSPGAGTSDNPMGAFQFNDVPQGNYTLYVYSANYDGNRGSIIDLATANGGVADQGLNATTNNGGDTCVPLIEGNNYVFFTNVVADQFGNIAGTYVPNPAGTLTGEGQVDAFQLVLTPSTTQNPVTIANGTPGTVVITWASGTLQSSSSVTGPWTNVTGASPLTVTITGSQEFYRVQ